MTHMLLAKHTWPRDSKSGNSPLENNITQKRILATHPTIDRESVVVASFSCFFDLEKKRQQNFETNFVE